MWSTRAADAKLLYAVCHVVFKRLGRTIYSYMRSRQVTISLSPTQCTYTRKKQHIYIRTRKNKSEQFEMCVLITVLLHEIAHVLDTNRGHTESFWKIYDNLMHIFSQNLVCEPPASYNPCSR